MILRDSFLKNKHSRLMKNVNLTHPYFMAHPFWDALRIHPQSKTFEA